MTKPLCVDLFCGLGGWTEGFLAEGYDVIGFDIEQHVYGDERYPGMLAIQDVRTIHGSQLKNAAVIVASSPCQKYSYMAMPWTKAKDLAKWYRDPAHPERLAELNDLFEQPKRIQREAIEAAGRFIPLIQENVRGAIPWVGRSQWHYGSFHLWGDVPALMPTTTVTKLGDGASWYPPNDPRHQPGLDFTRLAGVKAGKANPDAKQMQNWGRADGVKQSGISGTRANGKGDRWFQDGAAKHGSRSSARRAASARIAKIPFALAQHIAHVYHPARRAA